MKQAFFCLRRVRAAFVFHLSLPPANLLGNPWLANNTHTHRSHTQATIKKVKKKSIMLALTRSVSLFHRQ